MPKHIPGQSKKKKEIEEKKKNRKENEVYGRNERKESREKL